MKYYNIKQIISYLLDLGFDPNFTEEDLDKANPGNPGITLENNNDDIRDTRNN